MNIEKVIPAISWLKNYKSRYFYFDLISGINLGVSMIPKAMAYALVAGLPPIYGLYASFVAPLVAILFGSNKLLFTPLVGVMTVLVFTALSPLAEPGTQEYVNLAATLSLIVGFLILLIVMYRSTFSKKRRATSCSSVKFFICWSANCSEVAVASFHPLCSGIS